MEQAEVLIQFPIRDKEQLGHLSKAQEELSKAGVTFDSGAGCGKRDWEFDWSLKGAAVFFKRFVTQGAEGNTTYPIIHNTSEE